MHQWGIKSVCSLISSVTIEIRFLVEVPEVDACYLIALCNLCGRNPPRGACLPPLNVSRCQCFTNVNDPSMVYAGEFCRPERAPITSPTSSLSGSTAVVVGVVAGIAGLFVVITAYLLIMSYYRNRRRRRSRLQPQYDHFRREIDDFMHRS